MSDDELVDVAALVPDAVLDVRYATPRNFLGRAVYPCAAVFLRRATARKLAQAAQFLRDKRLRLLLYDGYRPLSVQRLMWELKPDGRFVADPAKGSQHNRGAAVDCALCDAGGRPLPMPSDFDAFEPLACGDGPDVPRDAARNVAVLRQAMTSCGFSILRQEWWHFADPGGARSPLLDLPFEALIPRP